jgi:hypothetical protein
LDLPENESVEKSGYAGCRTKVSEHETVISGIRIGKCANSEVNADSTLDMRIQE